MTAKQRWDSFQIRAKIDEETGFLSDFPTVARIGLQTYTLPDGSQRREFRPASEVFAPESLETYSGKPITLGHTTVNSKNAKGVVVGATSGVGQREDAEVKCPLTVFDHDSIERAKRRQNAELSVGYTSIDIDKPGWGNEITGEYFFDDEKTDADEGRLKGDGWVKFDAVQTTIRVNHIAMVFRGRAGVAKLNLDAVQDFPYDDIEPEQSKEDSFMTVKIKLDGEVEHDVPEPVAAYINTLQTKASKVDSLEAERDQLKVKVDGIPAAVEAAVAKIKADAEEHQKLVKVAADAGVKTDGLDSKGIKIAYIKQVSGLDVSSKEDAYINSAFDFAVLSGDKMAEQRKSIVGDPSAKKDSADGAIIDPQQRFRKSAKK